ncbi:MAG: Ni/Fe hydrogenase subunit alpha [Deltaproteobacteria bacterium]|nr:Ni/Fe hydrogenase subunit alpha [Deltaproteobacteria bacterium]
MARTLTIDPVTRIEGHAQVEINFDDNNKVTSSYFKVIDFRGFETFLQGMQVELMPTITARICGTCPHAHHLAAAKTVDKVFGATAPRAAMLQREALNMGSILHSHGVHFFALAGPDLLLGINSDPAKRNIVGLLEAAPEVAKKALRLRTLGQKVAEVIGGRGTHPVTFVPGGVSRPLTTDQRDALKKMATEAVALGVELVDVGKNALLGQLELATSLPIEGHYLGTVNDGALDLYDGDLRLMSPDKSTLEFSVEDWTKHIFEETQAHSYSKYVSCKKDGGAVSYRVGSLARLNVADRMATPLAQAALEEYRSHGGQPCHQTVFFHYARLVELVYACEHLLALVSDEEIVSDEVRGKLGEPRNATAHVEAPRGVLIHDYEVDKEGIVKRANLLVATQQNSSAMDATIALIAEQNIDKSDEELLNTVEFGIRCYDPCLSCATHRVGEMKLDVICNRNGKPFRQVRR